MLACQFGISVTRKDVLRNREILIDAAVAVLVGVGLDVSLDEIARSAGVSPSTLYRHFVTREDLVEAVLDRLVEGVRLRSQIATALPDARASFRRVFAEVCDLSGREVAAFAQLAATSERTERFAQAIVLDIVGPATARLREAQGLRSGVSDDDIVAFIRMVESSPSTQTQRQMALEVLLDGLVV